MPRVTFSGDERTTEASEGESLLSVAARTGVPLVHACGGHAKCSTCRVLVTAGADGLGAPGVAERSMAEMRRFGPDVRLSCQALVRGDVTVRRLVLDDEDRQMVQDEVEGGGPRSVGEERRLGVLFCDIRDFTPFTEAQLPYDVVHVLNRHFKHVDAAVRRHGGRVDNFMGDGAMALFGLDDPAGAALAAVRCGLDLVGEAAAFGTWFEAHFGGRFRVGVGVHWGDAILGVVGAGERRRLTAIGDAVNLAARVEAANKEAGTSFLVTEDTYREVADRVNVGRRLAIPIRGKRGIHALYEVVGLADAPPGPGPACAGRPAAAS